MQLCQMDEWKDAPVCRNRLPGLHASLLANVRMMQAGHQGLFLGFGSLRKLDGEVYVSRRAADMPLLRSGALWQPRDEHSRCCPALPDRMPLTLSSVGSAAGHPALQGLYADREVPEDNYLPIRPSPALAIVANSLWDLGNRFV